MLRAFGATSPRPVSIAGADEGVSANAPDISVTITDETVSPLPADLVKMLHANGIAIIGAFMFGLDEDDEDVFERTADSAEEIRIDVPQFSIATPLPGTRLYQLLHREGRITEADWGKYDGGHVCFKPMRLSADKLQEGLWRVHGRCHSWPSSIKRMAMRISPLVWTTGWIYHKRVGKWMKRQAGTAL